MNTLEKIEAGDIFAYSETMARREYTAVYKKEGGWVIAWIEEIPGANTQGRTLKEAKENLREALLLILEENQKIAKKSGLRREKIIINTKA